ncbi:multicopper oxidase domain-containing protein [Streptomyces roseicoloratus]|uniref:Multicopper oxidase domain-containing protein n=1 Tax=Streptomyces roseicoloratus TaxID=2508722 RepID=A0ABY9S173_9ACTN|nr:multicopper oxidase domain-containing protein [Streptomyces roseicoloratus]WMX47581.1 multicopper oxidase domain-containing protein [Streptomyces roseicoloratus]
MRDGLTRRRVLAVGGALGAMAAGGLGLAAGLARHPAATGAELRSAVPLPPPYRVPLPLPEVLRPVSTTGGTDRYELVQREATAEILPGVRTRLWTYGGTFPGPTIESRRGRPVTVTHRNELPVPTVVHLHGGRTPAESDGYPTDLVLPRGWGATGGHGDGHPDGGTGHHGGGMRDPRAVTSELTRAYTFPLDQRPTLLWYHDHRMDFTAPAIWRGLAGLHVVRDDAEDALGLPAGPRELPLMITDRAFAADGSLDYPSLDPALRTRPGVREPYLAGVLGDVILVNGAPWPVHEVDAARYRLRVLNASNARHYELAFVDEGDGRIREFQQVGSDQGLLAGPSPTAPCPSPRPNATTWSSTSPASRSAPSSASSTASAPAARATSWPSASPAGHATTAASRASCPRTCPTGGAPTPSGSATSPFAPDAWARTAATAG